MGILDMLFGKNDQGQIWMRKTKGRLYDIIEMADKEDPKAKKEISLLFREGLTSEHHNEFRRKAYLPKAENGDANAQYWMGFLCDVIDRNKDEAYKWYNKAAEGGNTTAMLALAFRYGEYVNDPEMGNDVVVGFGYDKDKERYWTERAANLGDTKAQVQLGALYKEEGILEEAITWLLLASVSDKCEIRIKAWRELVDIYGDRIMHPEYYNEKTKEEFLEKILSCKQENPKDLDAYDEYAYEMAALDLGLLYYNQYQQLQEEKVAWKAAYCLTLAIRRGNDLAAEYIRKMPFVVPRELFDEWCKDAANLLYNPRF